MNEGGLIFEKIPAIMADLGAIEKTRASQGLKYKFRGIDDFLYALHPLFIEHEVFVMPRVVERSYELHISKNNRADQHHTHATVAYTIYAKDGSNIDCSVIAESMDSSDKADPQCMSVAFKTAMAQMFCVPTESTPDADNFSPETHNGGDDEADEVKASQVKQVRGALEDGGIADIVAEDYLRSIGKLNEDMTLDQISPTFAATITDDEGALVRMIDAIDEYKTNVDAELDGHAAGASEPGTTADDPPF